MAISLDAARAARGTRGRAGAARPRGGFGGFLPALPFLLPALVLYGIFLVYPLVRAISLSFTEWSGFGDPEWVGLDNYVRLFTTDPVFLVALQNTVIWTLLSLVVPIVIALPMAIALNGRLPGRVFFRSAFYLPAVLATVVVAMTWNLIYRPDVGFLNQMLETVGLGELTRAWLGDSQLALYAVFVAGIWSGVGSAMILFLAGLQAVPTELIESCRLDGGNRWHVFRYVEMPAIRPTVGIVLLLAIIGSLKAFDLIVAMTGGGPAGSTEVLSFYAWSQAITRHNYGAGAAIAVVLLLISLLAIIPYVRWQRRDGDD
jgi:raffinose/stachyose/melibiose transport system permease protein